MYSDNTLTRVRDHQATAHPNVQCEIFMRNTNDKVVPETKGTSQLLPDATKATIAKSRLADCISYGCYHCIFKSQQPETIYKHWKDNHKNSKITTKNIEFPSRPFLFRIAKTFQCCYCRRSSHFKDLKVHCLRSHPLETFAMIDNLEPRKCAVCSHDFQSADINAVIEHFKTTHKDLSSHLSTDPHIYLTDQLIDDVLSVLPREEVKCTQDRCNTVFFNMAEFDEHHTLTHADSHGKEYVAVPNDPLLYGCYYCKETATTESAMVAHIRSHIKDFKCNFCEKRFDKVEMVKVHHEIMHDSVDETYRNVDVQEHFSKYSAMKIMFPNGLVLTKSEAKLTKYGLMTDVLKLATKMNEDDLEVVRKRQEENNKKVSKDVVDDNQRPVKFPKDIKVVKKVKPLVIKKRNMKRNRIADSDTDDSDDSAPESLAKPARTLRKKRKTIAETVVPSKSSKPKIDSTSNSDENTPLKQLIPRLNSPSTRVSPRKAKPTVEAKPPSLDPKADAPAPSTSDNTEPSANKQAKDFDLSKLFIDIPFGASNMKVSCDKFAMLFNINPKLRLRRCDKLVPK